MEGNLIQHSFFFSQYEYICVNADNKQTKHSRHYGKLIILMMAKDYELSKQKQKLLVKLCQMGLSTVISMISFLIHVIIVQHSLHQMCR